MGTIRSERKDRRIGGNSRARNPAFSLRRLKINATTHSFPPPRDSSPSLPHSIRLAFVHIHCSLYLLSIFFAARRVSIPRAIARSPSYLSVAYFSLSPSLIASAAKLESNSPHVRPRACNFGAMVCVTYARVDVTLSRARLHVRVDHLSVL